MIKFLVHPTTHSVLAELDPGKELIVHDERLKRLVNHRISVSREFKELNCLSGWKIYPSHGNEIFVKAFELFFSKHLGCGYFWKDKQEYEADLEMSTEELVKKILSAHKESMKRKRNIEEAKEESEPKGKISSSGVDSDQESSS